MPIGAAPQVRDGFSAVAAAVALAGIALGVALVSCHPSRPTAAAAHDAGSAAPIEATAPAAPPPRGKQIVVAYSSNLLGEYEPCG